MVVRLLILMLLLPGSALFAEKLVVLPLADSQDDRSYDFALLQEALKATENEYGAVTIVLSGRQMVRERLIKEMNSGDLTIAASTYKQSLVGKTLVVPFPILRGLESYRMFFVSQKTSMRTDNVSEFSHLKKFRFGQGAEWSTAKVLEDAGLPVVYSKINESLIDMLNHNRFDLYMRGSTEVVEEWPWVSEKYPNIRIDENLTIYCYLPLYYHVPLNRPDLAKRLEQGLKILFEEGAIDRLLAPSIEKIEKLVKQPGRKVLYLENTNLAPGMYERDKPYLLDLGIIHEQ